MLTLRRLTLFTVLALAGPLASAQDVLTPHKVAELRSVSSSAISPDGATVAYTVSVPREPGVDEDGSAWSELHVLERASGRARPFITGEVSVRSVGWTPDGAGITFLSKRDGDEGTSLYVLPIDGGEARRVASLDTAIRAYSLAPDGERVALVATEKPDAAKKKLKDKGFKQEIYEEDLQFAHVWIAELGEGETEARKLDVEGHVYQVEWSPVGEQLLISRAPTPLVDDQYMKQRVAIVSATDGAVRTVIENPGKLGAIHWSPDGKLVAMVAAADIHDPTAARLLVADAGTGSFFEVLPSYEADVGAIAWKDADTVLFVASHGCETALERVDVGGGRGDELVQIVAPGAAVMRSLSLSDDGLQAALVASTPAHPPELYTMDHGDAAPARVSDVNPWLADLRLAQQEVITWKARDGLELEGVLVRPLDEVRGQRYPLILVVHGGPEAHEQNGWQTYYSKPGQVGAAEGFAVFYPNYRGSTGRGIEFAKLSQGDPAGKEFDDLVDAVDHLIEIGLVDGDKVGVTGGSYGGYATAWCSTALTERFAAGVMFVGISDNLSKIGTTDIPDEMFYVHALRRYWEDWQYYLERSPIYHADGARTPLLILHGKDDPRVDPGQSREMYRHLKLRGEAPVRLVLYPGEGHGNRKAAARLDYNLRLMRWMEHYLKGEGGEPPATDVDYEEPEESVGP